jgi:hypothetical protein
VPYANDSPDISAGTPRSTSSCNPKPQTPSGFSGTKTSITQNPDGTYTSANGRIIYTNETGLPEPVVLALIADDYSRGESNRSVTQLIDSPRYRILHKEHVITMDVSELVWIALGKSMHKMFENAARGRYVSERRVYADILDWNVSGAVDLQYDKGHQRVKLIDYKSTSVWKIIHGYREWFNQLNFYAWLVEQDMGITVYELEVVALLRDWKLREATQGGNKQYPKAPLIIVSIPLWSREERSRYVHERVQLHQDAEFQRLTGSALPHCTAIERWEKATSYAVIKNKNKRAVRVLDDATDAERWIEDWKEKNPDAKDKLRIEVRPGEATRCALGYCRVAEWCDQYQAEIADESIQ